MIATWLAIAGRPRRASPTRIRLLTRLEEVQTASTSPGAAARVVMAAIMPHLATRYPGSQSREGRLTFSDFTKLVVWAGFPDWWGYWHRTSDLLGVNELYESQYWSLVQLTGLLRSYEVS